jgi:hypothetical protein
MHSPPEHSVERHCVPWVHAEPVMSVAEQTPPAQKPLRQSASPEHARPLPFAPHVPSAQMPERQASLPVQALPSDSCDAQVPLAH